MSFVIDASALLAFLHNEHGGDSVSKYLHGGLVSTVNWSEIIQKSISHNVNIRGMREDFIGLGVEFVHFTTAQSELAAGLWNQTQEFGLSLADRACLALGLVHQCPVVTADRVWKKMPLDLEIKLIR